MKNTTMRMAIVYPATEAEPNTETMRTRPIQLACAMANCRMPASETRIRRNITLKFTRSCRARMRMRSDAVQQPVELVQHADAAPRQCGQRRAGHAQCGKRPLSPKIRHGSSIRLMMFDTHSSRMAMAASPAPRKIALLRNSMTIAPQPPSAMRA